jgi:hypothetical protein
MIESDALRVTAQQFLSLTDEMLLTAEQGRWNDFLAVHRAREDQMAVLIREAGTRLLVRLPELRASFQRALLTSQRIDALVRARRDDLGAHLSSIQHRRKLSSAYR